MYREVTDKATWLKYWNEEHTFPQWFIEANDVWTADKDSFLTFCRNCWGIFEIDGQCLVYVEKTGEIHVAVLREVDIDAVQTGLIALRNYLLNTFTMLFGWIVRQNKGMQRVAKIIGMNFYGIKMFHGVFHERVIEWHCYSMLKTDVFAIENP